MRLFHFSDDPSITSFQPRPVDVPTVGPAGLEWLNGPLVWAIDEPHQALYLFPRDCPRILLWPTPQTTAEDRAKWWGTRTCRMIACIESAWLDRVKADFIYRYELPADSFISLQDAGMWVSHTTVEPIGFAKLGNLPKQLEALGVELLAVENLTSLKPAWGTSLHFSGIRLRNAKEWDG